MLRQLVGKGHAEFSQQAARLAGAASVPAKVVRGRQEDQQPGPITCLQSWPRTGRSAPPAGRSVQAEAGGLFALARPMEAATNMSEGDRLLEGGGGG